MKLSVPLLLVGIIVIVVDQEPAQRALRGGARGRFPGPDLPARYRHHRASYLGDEAFGSDSSITAPHGADCAHTHDGGGMRHCGS
jgi:hypothetical protein